MPRFVKIDQDDGSILLINTGYIVKARYSIRNNSAGMMHCLDIEVADTSPFEVHRINFESKYAAVAFLEKNFLLFNS